MSGMQVLVRRGILSVLKTGAGSGDVWSGNLGYEEEGNTEA